jgi:hypothetical protein
MVMKMMMMMMIIITTTTTIIIIIMQTKQELEWCDQFSNWLWAEQLSPSRGKIFLLFVFSRLVVGLT